MISELETVVDAVRYLYTITTKCHVKQHRIQKMQQILHQASTTYPTYNKKNNPLKRFTSIYLLLQLYEHYNPSIFTTLTNDATTASDKLTLLPPMSTPTIHGELSKCLQCRYSCQFIYPPSPPFRDDYLLEEINRAA
jgi:hypothetical protein